MTEFDPTRFIPDTSDGSVRLERCPVPPHEWGPGVMVRNSRRAGWQHVPPPDPRDRWEPAQPPATSEQPIAVVLWRDGESVAVGLASMRLALDEDCIRIRAARCDVAAWSEARPKDNIAEIGLMLPQATYLRDALTAMLERVK